MSQISVVIPSYKRSDLLQRLMESIRRQTMKDFEVLVVDDASPDRDAYQRVVERFSPYLSLRYLRNDNNCGAQRSRNRGAAESTGDLVAFVDDDDEWLPCKLERQAALFRSATEQLGLVYAWADAVNEDGAVKHRYRATEHGDVLPQLLDACFIPSPTVVVRRAALVATGGFDEAMASCQDWDMWTRIVAAGYRVDVATEVLALHHKHGRESIGTSPRSLEGFLRYYSKHGALYAQAGLARNLSEKYRGLARQASGAGRRDIAEVALRRSLELSKTNARAWVRYAQFLATGRG